MEPGYSGSKDGVQNRLRRIEGQVRGLQRMVEEDKYCIDVLTQISAATKALQSVALELLDEHLNHCVSDAISAGGPAGAGGGHEQHHLRRRLGADAVHDAHACRGAPPVAGIREHAAVAVEVAVADDDGTVHRLAPHLLVLVAVRAPVVVRVVVLELDHGGAVAQPAPHRGQRRQHQRPAAAHPEPGAVTHQPEQHVRPHHHQGHPGDAAHHVVERRGHGGPTDDGHDPEHDHHGAVGEGVDGRQAERPARRPLGAGDVADGGQVVDVEAVAEAEGERRPEQAGPHGVRSQHGAEA